MITDRHSPTPLMKKKLLFTLIPGASVLIGVLVGLEMLGLLRPRPAPASWSNPTSRR